MAARSARSVQRVPGAVAPRPGATHPPEPQRRARRRRGRLQRRRVPDDFDVETGLSPDCDADAQPDECEELLLTLTATDLAWTAAYDAIGYDVVRGSLAILRDTLGDFTAAVDSCVVNDTTATTWPHGAAPAAGAGFWYLVRAERGTGPLTYDAPGGGQVGSRDAEIDASPNACP